MGLYICVFDILGGESLFSNRLRQNYSGQAKLRRRDEGGQNFYPIGSQCDSLGRFPSPIFCFYSLEHQV